MQLIEILSLQLFILELQLSMKVSKMQLHVPFIIESDLVFSVSVE